MTTTATATTKRPWPQTCVHCGQRPVRQRQSNYCYRCGPHPATPPPCQRCGTTENYYTAGLCARCHRFSPMTIDSCEDCWAWGATRTNKWLCFGCRMWRKKGSFDTCTACHRTVAVNASGTCRLCWRHAQWVGTDDVAAAVKDGQQLFFADMLRSRGTRAPRLGPPRRPGGVRRFAATGARPPIEMQWTIFDALRPNTVTTPRPCTRCGARPVIKATSVYCYQCQPGGPVAPPPCRKCGTTENYYTAGLCIRCHKNSPLAVDSCPDCDAWGTRRANAWLCEGCRAWRRHHPEVDACRLCHRRSHLDENRTCRLCRKQALWLPEDTDIAAFVRHGHQLFFADMFTGLGVKVDRAARSERRRTRIPPPVPVRHPVANRQTVAFELPRDLRAGKRHGFPDPRDPGLVAYLDAVAGELGHRYGWRPQVITRVRAGLHILLGLQDTPGAPINASNVAALTVLGTEISVPRTLDVLAATGFLHEDRTPSIERWFDDKTAELPTAMIAELRVWFDVMRHGSTTPPRRKPRHPRTAVVKLRWALPALQVWAAAGHDHLREISRDDVKAVLPGSGTPRLTMLQGLRSIFGVLKARKLVFVNPTSRIPAGQPARRIPLPTPVDRIRVALTSEDSTCAVIAALVAFHGLAPHEVRDLMVTDLRDGRLRLDGRTIPLAEPVRHRLRAYLDYRATRWPATANPHLIIHYRSATHLGPVQADWLTHRLGISAQALREDRILHELHATGGDIRRLCDLFGLSIGGAERYAATLDHPALIQSEAEWQRRRTAVDNPRSPIP